MSFPSAPARLPSRLVLLLLAGAATTWALDEDLRLVPQLAVGSSGFEPGVALEWRSLRFPGIIIRPEVLLNRDHQLGGGGAVLYDLGLRVGLPTN